MLESPLCVAAESVRITAEITQVLVKENRCYSATVTQVLVKGRPNTSNIDAAKLKKSFMQKLSN